MSYVQSKSQQFASSASARTLTFDSNVTVGNFVYVFVGSDDASNACTVSVSDNLSNPYSSIGTKRKVGGTLAGHLYLVQVETGGSCTVTVTPSTTASLTIVLFERTGLENLEDNYYDTSGNGTAPSLGTITINYPNSEVTAVLFGQLEVPLSPPTGYTARESHAGSPTNTCYGVDRTTSSNHTLTFTYGMPEDYVAIALVLTPIGSVQPDLPPTHAPDQRYFPQPDFNHQWYGHQTRWPISQAGPIPDSPQPKSGSQRFHPQPVLDHGWWQQRRTRPIPETFLPGPPVLNPPHDQRYFPQPEWADVWWQQRRFSFPPPITAITSRKLGLYGVQVSVQSRKLGNYRIKNDIDGYVLYLGEDALPNLDGTPDAFSATLPFNLAVTPPVSGTKTVYAVVRKRDSYGLESQNQNAKVFVIDSAGNLVLPPIPAPVGLRLIARAGGMIEVRATYPGWQTDDYPADLWKVWVDTVTPDTSDPVSATADVTGSTVGVLAGPYVPGDYFVSVGLYRTADTSLSPVVTGTVTLPDDADKPAPVRSGREYPPMS